jgi:hypothetical protein
MQIRHLMAALAATSILALAACGDDDEDGGGDGAAAPAQVSFELSGSGKNLTMSAPESVEAGVAELSFRNSTKKESDAQLVRVDGGRSPREVLTAAEAWAGQGKALPEWIHLEGGVGTVPADGSGTAIQELVPGSYIAVSIATNTFTEFEVTEGAGEASLPTTDASVDAVDYAFESTGLTAGTASITIDNKGEQPHFVAASKLKSGKSIADVRKFVRTEKGPPPVDFENTWDTSVLDGGKKQVVELNLEPGKYALICWVPDRAGGPPHAVKGMISEAVVR